MSHLGSFAANAVFDTKFCTVQSTGAPTTLSGSPVVKVYKNNSTSTETATGITLTVDFDGVTGLNNVNVDVATAGLAAGDNCQLVITTGTVNSVSAVGYVIAEFSVARAITTPAGAAVTAVPGDTATLAAKVDFIMAMFKNKITQTATTMLLKQADGTTTAGTATVSDDGTTFTRNAMS